MMMRYPGLLMALLCAAAIAPLHAAQAKDERAAVTPQETPATAPGPADKKNTRQAAKPATTFKPSEKIRADSAVSFPVDI